MTDYGHDLLFGTFVTPTAEDPRQAVDLAVTADRAGLDLVTFQDHPYQPGFLDTWTLLSYAAARTERVRLSGNVLSLPLRPPAVLARAAASLDVHIAATAPGRDVGPTTRITLASIAKGPVSSGTSNSTVIGSPTSNATS